MPVHVDIKVNDRLINQVHIGRMENLYDTQQVSTYLVVEGIMEPSEVPYSKKGIEFYHRYSDGLEVCVEKGLAALRDSKEMY